MSDFEDLDDVFGALRSPATSSELSGETGMVDLMTNHHRATKGPTTMFTSRRSRVAVLITAGVIGFGGIAAASPGGFGRGRSEPVVVDTTSTTSTSTTSTAEVTTTTGVPEDESVERTEAVVVETEAVAPTTQADDPDTEFFDETTCLEGNHGKTVSAVARDEDPFKDIEVRDAARSSCGKDDDESEAVEDDAEDESIEDDSDEVEVDDESDDEEDSSEDHAEERSGKGAGNKPAEPRGGGNGKSGKDD